MEPAAGSSIVHALRASTINPSQLAIRNKIVFLCLVGGERIGERREVDSHARASSSMCS
jgi:UDP-N-acetylglucosamine enolpyruvyl transferase